MISHPNTKINLGLNVLRKRADGYHDIETVFVPYFGYCDVLEIVRGDDFSATLAGLVEKYGGKKGCGSEEGVEERDGIGSNECGNGSCIEVEKVGCEDNDGVEKLRQGITEDGKCMITIAREEGVDWEPVNDLCVRAYKVLDDDFGLPSVKIFLEKLSPVGAGLGGGSADAAFTLRMLSEMFGLNLDDNALAQYAARLGSDCPFFVWNRPMLGRGRGEILSPVDLPQLDTYNIKVIVPPGIRVSTASAYRGIIPREQSMSKTFNEDRPGQSSAENSCDRQYPSFHETGTLLYDGTPAAKNSELLKVLNGPIKEWRDTVVNDFEKTVFARHPQLAALKQSLYDVGALYASLSGTGSALFGLFRR